MKHEVTPRNYLFTLLALLVLTAVSYWVASLHLGAWEMPVALIIAGIKGTLVVLFFMHLVEQRATNQIALLTSVAFVAILVFFVVADVFARAPTTVVLPSAWD